MKRTINLLRCVCGDRMSDHYFGRWGWACRPGCPCSKRRRRGTVVVGDLLGDLPGTVVELAVKAVAKVFD